MTSFREIEGYEGLYAVSSTGIVKSLDRTVTQKNGKVMFYPGKILQPDQTTMSNTTYYRVSLSKNHKVTRYLVHRLVAKAFIATDDATLHINHIDNDATNNNVSNLEWCTHSENMLHAQRQGRLRASQCKGGKKIAAIEHNAAIERIVNHVGFTSGLLEIIGYAGYFGNGKHPKHYAKCWCHGCQTEHSIYAYSVFSQRTKSCLKCSRKKI